jgi:polysaccharide pyruvyl transferase WcaK-like protein
VNSGRLHTRTDNAIIRKNPQISVIIGENMANIENKKRILIRSSWQSVNIGDIGHTPGLLEILRRNRPDLKLTLWPCDVGHGVKAMLQREFPDVAIIEGEVNSPALQTAFAEHDFMLNGSGPGVVCAKDLMEWRRITGKPYGIFGVTIESLTPELKDLLDNADFIYCRETVSANFIRDAQVKCPVIEFGPDATFAINLRDDSTAKTFLNQHGLVQDRFVCVIPRLRYTPYYKIHNYAPSDEELRRNEVSSEFAEPDHAKLRDAIINILDNTNMKILICAEMTYEVGLGKELILDRLPEKYLSRVVWRDNYWRPDEAASVYAAAALVVSFEMHSPIIALAVGTPAIYLRQPTDTCKGQMWRDIGLSEWIFEIEDTDGSKIAEQAVNIINNQLEAKKLAQQSLDYARTLQNIAFKGHL